MLAVDDRSIACGIEVNVTRSESVLLAVENGAKIWDECRKVEHTTKRDRVVSWREDYVVEIGRAETDLARHQVEGQVAQPQGQHSRVGDVQVALQVVAISARRELKGQVLDGKTVKVVETLQLDGLLQVRVVVQLSKMDVES